MNLESKPKILEDQSFWDEIVKQNEKIQPLPKNHWDVNSDYNQKKQLDPLESLVNILKGFKFTTGRAIDIGAGNGADTVYLLKKNFTVTAIETNERARNYLMQNVEAQCKDKLSSLTLVDKSMEEYEFPDRAKIILASSSLPFCDPTKFQRLWNRMVHCLEPSGVIYATFFTQKQKGTMVMTLSQVKKLMETSYFNTYVNERKLDDKCSAIIALGQRKSTSPEFLREVYGTTRPESKILSFISSGDVDAPRLKSAVENRDFNLLLRLVATDRKHIELLKFLLDHRKDLNIDLAAKGKTSGTALDVATKKNNKEAIEILQNLK
jgi:hypothetical protein